MCDSYITTSNINLYFLFLVLHAVSAWLIDDNFNFLFYSGCAILIFRFELCILLGLLALVKLFKGKIGLFYCISCCLMLAPLIIGIFTLLLYQYNIYCYQNI